MHTNVNQIYTKHYIYNMYLSGNEFINSEYFSLARMMKRCY